MVEHGSVFSDGSKVFGENLQELELCMTVSVSWSQVPRSYRFGSLWTCKSLDERENMALVRLFDIVDSFGIRNYGHDSLFQCLIVVEYSNKIIF